MRRLLARVVGPELEVLGCIKISLELKGTWGEIVVWVTGIWRTGVGGAESVSEGGSSSLSASSKSYPGSSMSSSSSSEKSSCTEFSQELQQCLHKSLHRRPLFRQPQDPRQPLTHLQEIFFSSSSGAGFCTVTGDKPLPICWSPAPFRRI